MASEETKKKMSEVHKKLGTGKWMKGRKASPETIKKMVDKARRGEENHNWKGDDVGYFSLHAWVNRKLGRPRVCDHCGTTSAKRYEWANKCGLYKRDVNDWLRLCKSCHVKYDNQRKGQALD